MASDFCLLKQVTKFESTLDLQGYCINGSIIFFKVHIILNCNNIVIFILDLGFLFSIILRWFKSLCGNS